MKDRSLKARARRLYVDAATLIVIVILAFGLGAITVASGFSSTTAVLVGTVTGAFSWWTVVSEP